MLMYITPSKPEIHQVPKWNEHRCYFKRNELLRFPMRLEGGASKKGYVAFLVGTPNETTELDKVRVESEFGEIVITDNLTKAVLKRFKKRPNMFLS